MSDTITLQLKNKAIVGPNGVSEFQQQAGQWTTNIQEKIMIEEGDNIVMKSAYIDTNASSSQKVVIKEDTHLELKHVHYQMNQQLMYGYQAGEGSTYSTEDTGFEPPNKYIGDWWQNYWSARYYNSKYQYPYGPTEDFAQRAIASTFADGEMYLDCSAHIGDSEDRVIQSLKFMVENPLDPKTRPATWGGFTLAITYKSLRTGTNETGFIPGVETTVTREIPLLNSAGFKTWSVNMAILFDGGAVAPIPVKMVAINRVTGVESGDLTQGQVYGGCHLDTAPAGKKLVWPTDYSTSLNGIDSYDPIVYDSRIMIPKGNYDPADLCAVINREFQRGIVNTATNGKELSINTLLKNIPTTAGNTWVRPISTADTSAVVGSKYSAWNSYTTAEMPSANCADWRYRYGRVGNGSALGEGVDDEGSSGNFSYVGTEDQGPYNLQGTWSGTSQLQMAFDDNTNRFYWSYTHMPIYNGSTEESVGYFLADSVPIWGIGIGVNTGTGGANGDISEMVGNPTYIKEMTAAGGVLFTEMNSWDSTGPTTFWADVLGFSQDMTDPDCMLVSITHEPNKPLAQPDVNKFGERPHIYKGVLGAKNFVDAAPVVGVHMTAGYLGMSDAVAVTANVSPTTPSFLKSDAMAVRAGKYACNSHPLILSTSNSKTTPVLGGKGVLTNDVTSGFGYYLIEIDSNFGGNFITSDQNKKSVVAIASKYYVKDSYTSVASDASLIYTHRGPPQLLSTFNVRISNSDNQLASNLGVDNTVFLSIIKNNPKPGPKTLQ